MTRLCRLAAAVLVLGLAAGPALAIDLNPLSVIKSAVEAAVEDRSAEDIAKDLELKAKITAQVIDQMGTDVIAINADVYEQSVMLTGAVEKEDQKNRTGRLAAAVDVDVDVVKRVHNEILVIKPLDKQKGAAEAFVDDTVIEGKINALLLDAGGINVTNFRWRSVQGRVFLFGRALSKPELDKAIAIVRDIENVITVTSRVKVVPKG